MDTRFVDQIGRSPRVQDGPVCPARICQVHESLGNLGHDSEQLLNLCHQLRDRLGPHALRSEQQKMCAATAVKEVDAKVGLSVQIDGVRGTVGDCNDVIQDIMSRLEI
jgi:hypothetical protein